MKVLSNTLRRGPVTDHTRAAAQGEDLAWRYPARRYDTRKDVPAGPAICERCHASLETDHWRYDEHRYCELQERSDVHHMLCPGCLKIERRLYEGEVEVRHSWEAAVKEDVIHTIHNEEARVRAANPGARIAVMEDKDHLLYILTTSAFLAERIGKVVRNAHHGSLTITPLPRERFTRVRWVQ